MILILCLIACLGLVIYLHRHFAYWERLGFAQKKLSFVERILGPLNLKFPTSYEYGQLKHHGVFGMYFSVVPIAMITDPTIISNILVKDHDKFFNRKSSVDRVNDSLGYNLISMQDKEWKHARLALSPAFMAIKMKHAIPVIEHVYTNLEKFVANNGKCEVHDLMIRTMADIIGLWSFNLKNDSINDPNPTNGFYRASVQFFSTDWFPAFKNLCWFFMPGVLKLIKGKLVGGQSEIFFRTLIKDIVQFRDNEKFKNNDFMQFLINVKEKDPEFGHEELAAQATMSFYAALDTTAGTIALALFEIGKSETIQSKVHAEIDDIMSKSEGSIYDDLKQMKYLDCIIDETLRKYPTVNAVNRLNTEDYKIESKNLTIPKGTMIYISSFRVHRDPNIFEDPLEFRPERFQQSPKGCDHAGIPYFPFGSGHRNCIGQNFAKICIKLILARLLRNFNLKTDGDEIEFSKMTLLLTPTHDLNVEFTKRF